MFKKAKFGRGAAVVIGAFVVASSVVAGMMTRVDRLVDEPTVWVERRTVAHVPIGVESSDYWRVALHVAAPIPKARLMWDLCVIEASSSAKDQPLVCGNSRYEGSVFEVSDELWRLDEKPAIVPVQLRAYAMVSNELDGDSINGKLKLRSIPATRFAPMNDLVGIEEMAAKIADSLQVTLKNVEPAPPSRRSTDNFGTPDGSRRAVRMTFRGHIECRVVRLDRNFRLGEEVSVVSHWNSDEGDFTGVDLEVYDSDKAAPLIWMDLGSARETSIVVRKGKIVEP